MEKLMRINQLKKVILALLLTLSYQSAMMAEDSLAVDSVSPDSEEFVTASLLISAPLKALYSVFGHATLRMECPTHQLDCIYTFESEANMGTFMTGVAGKAKAKYADTLESLERIKAKGTYELMDRMLDLFADRLVPVDEDERIEVFDQIQSEHADEIAELDDRFYDVGENLVALTLSFVQKNLKDFR